MEYLFYLLCFSRNIFFSKQFRYVHINLPKKPLTHEQKKLTLRKKRRRFLPVKLCTGKVNIFLYCEFICKFSLSNMYFPTRV